MSGNSFPL
jgi:hypothetical protein